MPVQALRVFGKSTQSSTTGANLLKPNSYNVYHELPLKAGTVVTLMTNGQLSEGGNIKFIGMEDETVWFSIDKGETRVCRSIGNKDVKGFNNELVKKEGLEYMFALGDVKTFEPYTGGTASPSIKYPQDIEIAGGNGNLTVRVGTSEEDANPQTVILHTPNGLPGIPISSDGNYTDTSGQQWICDSIEYDSVTDQKEYVQRVGLFRAIDGFDNAKIGITGSESDVKRIIITLSDADPESKRKPVLCTHGRFYSNGAKEGTTFTYNGGIWYTTAFKTLTVDEARTFLVENQMEWLYILKEPIRTALTQEQVAALKGLYTCFPTTVITNDGNANMELEYTVNTQSYVDTKIAEISTAIIQKGF